MTATAHPSFEAAEDAAERGVIGLILTTNTLLKHALDTGLRPEHFRIRHAFDAMLRLADRRDPITPETLAAEIVSLGGHASPDSLDGLTAEALDSFTTTDVQALARRVQEAHDWRTTALATQRLTVAYQRRDQDARREALDLLAAPAENENRTHTASQVRAAASRRLDNPETKPAGVPFPFDKLNRGGGMRPAQLTVVGARQKQGKSVFADMCIDKAAMHADRATWVGEPHLYLLEMSEEERVERFQARLALVDHSRIMTGDLSPDELRRVGAATERIPCGMTDAAGWSPLDVVRHAQLHCYRFIVVDHMHLFSLPDEPAVSECVRVFRNFAAREKAHVILCAQLNEKRVVDQQRPRPTMTDLRGSGMIAATAHYVTFVYRPDDEKGREGDTGQIWHAACRSGRPYVGESVRLKGEWMRFEVDDSTNEDWRADL